MPKPQELVKPRIISYFKSSWYARWIVIIIVLVSFWFLPDMNRALILALASLASAYNALLLLGTRLNWNTLTDQRVMLAIDSALALLLVVLTNGTESPYLLVLVLVVTSGSFWYGVKVSYVIVISQALVLFAQLQLGLSPLGGSLKELAVQVLFLLNIGLYVSWLTGSERSERNKLIVLGTETEKERLQLIALINNMRDAVLVVDNDDRVLIHNEAASALAGKEIHGQPIGQSLQFVDAEGRAAELNVRSNYDDESRQNDLRVKAPDGSFVNVAVNIAPYIVDRQNRGHVLIIRDVSQEKTIDKEREEFIAVASHELRTPLTIAQNSLSFVMTPPYLPKNEESVEMLNSAQRSLKQLSHIISDLTNLSQVEHEQLNVQLEPLNPVALAHEFQSDYSGQTKAKGIDLQIRIDPELNSSTILTSRYVVSEILSIYMNNALKFTDKGSITLSVTNPQDMKSGVTFSVSDTGIGISQSDQDKIFKKFFQSEDYATRVHGGTGLGLYIAQRLARRITAKIWFETKLNEGSTFYLWVPPYSQHRQDRGKVAAAETKDFFNTV